MKEPQDPLPLGRGTPSQCPALLRSCRNPGLLFYFIHYLLSLPCIPPTEVLPCLNPDMEKDFIYLFIFNQG